MMSNLVVVYDGYGHGYGDVPGQKESEGNADDDGREWREVERGVA